MPLAGTGKCTALREGKVGARVCRNNPFANRTPLTKDLNYPNHAKKSQLYIEDIIDG